MPMPCTDMNSACASASTAMLRRCGSAAEAGKASWETSAPAAEIGNRGIAGAVRPLQ